MHTRVGQIFSYQKVQKSASPMQKLHTKLKPIQIEIMEISFDFQIRFV